MPQLIKKYSFLNYWGETLIPPTSGPKNIFMSSMLLIYKNVHYALRNNDSRCWVPMWLKPASVFLLLDMPPCRAEAVHGCTMPDGPKAQNCALLYRMSFINKIVHRVVRQATVITKIKIKKKSVNTHSPVLFFFFFPQFLFILSFFGDPENEHMLFVSSHVKNLYFTKWC